MKHILARWATLADLARDMGKPYPTVAAWVQRGNVPAKYDLDLLKSAKTRGIHLTLDEIAQARSRNQEAAP